MSDEADAPPEAEAPSPIGSQLSSAPPEPHGEQIPAARLHPLWEASRGAAANNEGGRGGRGGRGGGLDGGKKGGRGRGASEVGDRPRFERISLAALEQTHFNEADGADSALNSEDEEQRRPPPSRKRKPAEESGPRRERPGDSSESEEEEERRDKLSGLMGAAVFGGGAQRPVYGQASFDGSEVSESSTKMRQTAQKEVYPVRGVTCVGCALSNRIGAVDAFIKANVSKMTDIALFKMAALCYRREVAEPAEREGAIVPSWSWKDVEVHYRLHSTGNTISRHMMIRSLQNMRAQAEERIVRCDNGEKELDRQGADLLLKIIAAESRERALLEGRTANGQGKGR